MLGILQHHYKFILPNFSNQAKRMICQLRSKDDTIKWTDKMTKELENIRNQLKGNPKLYYPSFDNEFSLYSDASAWGLVWYLTQGNGKHEHTITIVYIGVSLPPPSPTLKNNMPLFLTNSPLKSPNCPSPPF